MCIKSLHVILKSELLKLFISLKNFNYRNGGVCTQPTIGSYTCSCPCGFTGPRCEVRISFCALNTTYCQNGATCVENQPCVVKFE